VFAVVMHRVGRLRPTSARWHIVFFVIPFFNLSSYLLAFLPANPPQVKQMFWLARFSNRVGKRLVARFVDDVYCHFPGDHFLAYRTRLADNIAPKFHRPAYPAMPRAVPVMFAFCFFYHTFWKRVSPRGQLKYTRVIPLILAMASAAPLTP